MGAGLRVGSALSSDQLERPRALPRTLSSLVSLSLSLSHLVALLSRSTCHSSRLRVSPRSKACRLLYKTTYSSSTELIKLVSI